jgi:hypothetical protein
MNVLTRREFLGLGMLAALRVSVRDVGAPLTLRIVLVLPPGDALSGALLGASESARAGALFGQHIVTMTRSLSDAAKEDAPVLIGGSSYEQAVALEKIADERGRVFFNVSARSDELRGGRCSPMMFHVAPSEAMIGKAKLTAGATTAGPISIELWSATLERYGASQLNDRYRARFGRSMTSAAWAGWVAVKIAWETSLRARSVDSSALLRTLDGDAIQFDGHKGTPLSFRSWDHQLRQPLYAVERVANRERVVQELPDVARNTARSMLDELDEFGDDRSKSSCSFKR